MIPAWLRNPAGFVLAIALALGLLSTLTLASEIGRPFGGFVSTSFIAPLAASETIVKQDTPIWWPIYRSEIPIDDDTHLLAIDGRLLAASDVSEVFSDTWAAGRSTVSIEFSRPRANRVGTIQLTLIDFDFIHFLELKLPELIIGLCFWLTAVVVLKARPQEPLNQVFATIASLVAVQRWLQVHTLSLRLDSPSLPLEVALMAVAGFISIVFLHFVLLFPERLSPWPRKMMAAAYVTAAGLAVLQVAGRMPAIRRLPGPLRTTVLNWSDYTYRLVLLLYLVATGLFFGRMIWMWRQSRQSPRQKRIAVIVALGLVLAAPMILVAADYIVPGLGAETGLFWQGLDLRYLFLTVPLSLAFVIVRYQSMRSPSRLLIVVLALAGSALLASLLSWLWGLAQADWPASGEHPPFPYIFAGIFVASLFWATQANWRGWLGRLLDWDTQSYAATRAFGRRVSGTTNPDTLAQTMAQALVDELQLVCAAVWRWRPESGIFQLAAATGEIISPLPVRLLPGSASPLPANRPLRLDLPDDAPDWLIPLREQRAIDVIVPLSGDDHQVLGLLGLGHRWDEEVYDDRDLVIAELIGQQAALFLLAAVQVEELRALPQRVVAAQESERRRLAAELHDTVQQFLGGLPFALSFTPEQIRRDPDGVADALAACLNDTEAMAETVRRIRFNLAPSQLERSLVSSVRELANHVTRRTGLPVTLTVGEGVDETTTLAAREALYRVMQQALDNVVAHARATLAEVRLACEGERVVVRIIDNGRGSSEAERQDAALRHHVGLQSMQARLEWCGGGFEFQSVPGAGTVVFGWVPAAASASNSGQQ